jgi:carbamoylphosphate synthase large subunit
MRDAAFAIMRAVGVETGGSNVQFGVNPNPKPGPDGKKPFEMVVIEMNPRVSRSSALASKATGFPIAKIAAKLAIGYTLDELKNDITGTTSACFEPTIDYVVTKMPRWTFEKFPDADETLTTQMKSVGEAMAIGRTFKESFQKVIRSMDIKRFGLGLDRNDKWLTAMRAVEHGQLMLDVMGDPGMASGGTALQSGVPGGSALQSGISAVKKPITALESGATKDQESSPTGLRTADGSPIEWPIPSDKLSRKLAVPSQGRLYYVRYAMKMGWSIEKIHGLTHIDPFFLDQIQQLVQFEETLCNYRKLADVPAEVLFEAKQLGYSDAQLACLYLGKITPETILEVGEHRKLLGIKPVYKLVDTCAAEFEAVTPYYYSTYERSASSRNNAGTEAWHDSRMRFVDRFQHYQGEDEIRVTDRKKVIILGGGPNRIGQGIEFDYCCVHAAFAAKDLGFESVMINSNPETVSTDYDTSDLLFFEPLTLEDTVNIIERLNGRDLCRPGQLTGFRSKTFGEDARERTITQLNDWGFDGGVVESMMDVNPIDHEESSPCLLGIRVKDGRMVMVDPHSPRLMRGEGSGPPTFGTEMFKDSSNGRQSEDLVHGTIVQFGGQTPLNLAHGLVLAGVPIIGTSVDSIDLAEDRDRFDKVLEKLHLHRPPAGIARSIEEAVTIANRIGYPVLLRPSYVLGGRGMEICSDEKAIRAFIQNALKVSDLDGAPVLIDKFLSSATEVDVDVVADGETAIVSGLMEHIEHAGIHSGDSAMSIPAYSLKPELITEIKRIGTALAKELGVRGLMNLQLAVKHDADGDKAYILEVNPRASRTVPFISKAVHIPWPAIAAKVMMGKTLKELGAKETTLLNAYAVKESVFPFAKFPGVDFVLGPEMRSTGEVMGIDKSFPIAFAKSQMAGGMDIPTDPKRGGIFVSVRDEDKQEIASPVRTLAAIGFTIYATGGTADALEAAGVAVSRLQKIATGARPNVLDLMANKQLALIINTPTKTGYLTDEGKIRATAVRLNIPMISTMPAAHAIARAIVALRETGWGVAALQDYASK